MASGKSLLSELTSQILSKPADPAPRRNRSVSAPIALLREVEEHVERGTPLQLRLDQIDEGPYHVGALDPVRVAALAENLRHNPQSSPVVVRRKRDGRYELVAGRHRKAAFAQLQREEIAASVVNLSDDEAERLVFFDNLLAPALSDYEKYLGFAQRQNSKDCSYADLAKESGWSKSQVARFFSFSRLPAEAIELLKTRPAAVGANCAEKLVAFAKEHPETVTEAVRAMVEERLTQDEAVRQVAQAAQETVVSSAAEAAAPVAGRGAAAPAAVVGTQKLRVMHQDRVFAMVSVKGSRVAIKLSDESEAEGAVNAIMNYLRLRTESQ
ncbi:ParB/RepB/Spo0J family partition protein [Azohydromonas caseinilytica]|uniref:ParB/RepB/Spo0J family partition protein n=1 Tax=Azohydromonas caseinilytica TaxID=2728836 RepID=A0A848FHQ8_9BURK|nr:ParB/RepB/Spo0J family partition protein [Azohydromonas caseinilytica]NML18792.1 ParB/RepB/Spo0J family partition protein [Azohydromonas caseinilytica]